MASSDVLYIKPPAEAAGLMYRVLSSLSTALATPSHCRLGLLAFLGLGVEGFMKTYCICLL